MLKSSLCHDRHVLAQHGIQVAQTCPICQEILADPKALLEHKKSAHSNFVCYICAKSLMTLDSLNSHLSKQHPEVEKNVALGPALENSKHKPVKVFGNKKDEKVMCEICSKMIPKYKLKPHVQHEHGPPQFSCPKCPRTFRWDSSRKAHINSAHGDEFKTRMHTCDICGKQFKDVSNMKQHRYSHTGGPHSCSACGQGFIRKDQLKSHQSRCMKH